MADYNLFGLPPRGETPVPQNKYHQASKTTKKHQESRSRELGLLFVRTNE
jgi:hypothetical protein